MLVMDSGLGGLSVVRALKAAAPHATLTYLADTAYFPYGSRSAEQLDARAQTLLRALEKHTPLAAVVLACNTLSTLCLATLRAALPHAFVGTVPAIKTAAAQSHSKRFSLLATPNTAHSSYTSELIADFAQGCKVDAVGADHLAEMAEALLLGDRVADADLARAIAPAFCDNAQGRTDAIVLGCTHYPLILDRLRAVAPWGVRWIDSGEAIARRALSLAQEDTRPEHSVAYVTRAEDVDRYRALFLREGFDKVEALTL